MKKLILILIVLLSLTVLPTLAQQRRGKTGLGRNLTVAMAQQILNRHIDDFPDDCLFTCQACYDPNDKQENDNFPIVTSNTIPVAEFLMNEGYIRVSGDSQYFTAKAKRSSYFNPYGGFRFARLQNPKVMVNKITDPANVPIEYDFVPTELTMKFFGRVERVKAVASFVYQDGKWYLNGLK